MAENVKISTASQTAIKTITSDKVRSKTIVKCKREIENLLMMDCLGSILIPAFLEKVNVYNVLPFQNFKRKLTDWAKSEHKSIWDNTVVSLFMG